jgi:hypothetical protein
LPLNDHPLETTFSGNRMVYTILTQDTNIWRARVPRRGQPPAESELFIASTRRDEKPRYSPDGKAIAFTSLRSGSPEIWVAAMDGSSPRRVTAFGGPVVGYPFWSPDGRWLLFHARPEGQADLFVIPASGGPLKQLTRHPADDVMPSYSIDGHWIYFTSARSGRMEIWKVAVEGGEPVQMTSSGGERPFEAKDGKIYYGSLDGLRILSISASGGPPSEIAGPLHVWPSGFAITSRGVYYPAPPHRADRSFIRFRSFATGEDGAVGCVSPFLSRPQRVAARGLHSL